MTDKRLSEHEPRPAKLSESNGFPEPMAGTVHFPPSSESTYLGSTERVLQIIASGWCRR